MKTIFEVNLLNFLNEYMGEEIAKLREDNKEYRDALKERLQIIDGFKNDNLNSSMVNSSIELCELNEYIHDMESSCLFYAGMKIHDRINTVISKPYIYEKKLYGDK